MRALAVAVFLLFVSPAQAEYWEGDKLLDCLVGKAAVEMRHGAKADQALDTVRDECVKTAAEPEPSVEPEGDWDEEVDAMFSLAFDVLTAAQEAQAF